MRTLKTSLLCCVVVAFSVCGPHAGAQTYVSLAYGGTSCSMWNSRKPYISSYNAYVFNGPNVFDGSGAEDLRTWVDVYCKEHLDDSLDAVVRALIEERARKA